MVLQLQIIPHSEMQLNDGGNYLQHIAHDYFLILYNSL